MVAIRVLYLYDYVLSQFLPDCTEYLGPEQPSVDNSAWEHFDNSASVFVLEHSDMTAWEFSWELGYNSVEASDYI